MVGVAVRVAVPVTVGVAAAVNSPTQVLPFASLFMELGQIV
jgi:hypothetical protein